MMAILKSQTLTQRFQGMFDTISFTPYMYVSFIYVLQDDQFSLLNPHRSLEIYCVRTYMYSCWELPL